MQREIAEDRIEASRREGQELFIRDDARSGWLTVPADRLPVSYQATDGSLHDVGADFGRKRAFGPVELAMPIGPFPAGQPGFIIGVGEAYMLAEDVAFTPDSADDRAAVLDEAIAAITSLKG